MTRTLAALFVVLFAGVALAAEPAIRLPSLPAPPAQPMPAPDAVVTLTKEVLYVIDSDEPILVLASPTGLVSVVRDVGPIRVRGRFVDGNGQTETRTYSGKHVYFVEAAHTGRVELLIIPNLDEKKVIRRTIDVEAGEGPRPPPGPTPPVPTPPGPQPSGPGPFPADGGFRVLMVYDDNQDIPAAQQSVLFGAKVRDYLKSHCAVGPDGRTREFNIWLKGTDASLMPVYWSKAQALAGNSTPWIVLGNGREHFSGPLPPNEAEALQLLKRFGGE